MEVYGLTATLYFHPFMVCSGIGYWNVGTRGGLASGEAMSAVIKIGSRIVPMTPVWPTKVFGRVKIFPHLLGQVPRVVDCENVR